ncbi:MAG: Ig-like domain-containing protein [Pseudomonadota bacterium]
MTLETVRQPGAEAGVPFVVIDPRVDRRELLLADLPASAEVLLLNRGADGVVQIKDAVAGRRDVGSLHIVAHSDGRALQLGSGEVSAETLNACADDLIACGKALAGKDLLVYGCAIASTAEGRSLLEHLGRLTGANVAASTQTVGSTDAEVNWLLDFQVGEIAAPVVFSAALQASYPGHFATVTFSINTPAVDGTAAAIEDEANSIVFTFDVELAPGDAPLSEANPLNVYFFASDSENPNPFGDGSLAGDVRVQQINQLNLFGLSTVGISSLWDPFNADDVSLATGASGAPDFSVFRLPIVSTTATVTLPAFADFIAEDPTSYFWRVIDEPGGRDNTIVNTAVPFIEVDTRDDLPAGSVPEISISSNIDTLVEDEGTVATFTISLSEPPPSGGVVVPIRLENINLATGEIDDRPLGDFDVFPPGPFAEFDGLQLVRAWTANDGLTVNILEQTATVTLPIFDDPDRAPGDPGFNVNDDIGDEETTFSVVTVDDQGTSFDGFTISPTSGSVTVTLKDTNNVAPVADDDGYSTDFGAALTVNAANGVLDGDTDANGDDLSAEIATQPTNGSVSLNANGSFTYTPNVGFSGEDSFTYTVSDGNGGTDTGTVTVTVGEQPNQDPVADDDSYSTAFDTPLTVDAATGVLDGDSDPDGDALTVEIDTDPTGGTVTLNPDGSFTYTPNAGFSGPDTFTYTVSDGNGGTDTGTVTVTVGEQLNQDPIADDDSYSTAFDTPLTVDAATGVLDGDSDPDGDALTAEIDTDPSGGSVSLDSDGSFTYTPNVGFSGEDSFTYTLSDGNGGTDTGTVTVTVGEQPNQDPVADDDSYSTAFDTPLTVDAATGVLDGDSDPDGDALTVEIDTDPSGGSVSLDSDGSFTYTPNVGFSGEDSFTYTLSDGNGGTDTGTVTVTVGEQLNQDPIALDDDFTGFFLMPGDVATGSGADLLANDSDPDGDSLVIIGVGDPFNLTVDFDDGGTPDDPNDDEITFTITGDQGGSEASFSYTVSDGNGGSDSATATFSIETPVNADPIAVTDEATTDEATIASGNVLANDSDPDGDDLSVTAVNGEAADVGETVELASGALLTLGSDGAFDYDPNGVFDGLGDGEAETDSFVYEVSDGEGGTATATATVTVNGIGDEVLTLSLSIDPSTLSEGDVPSLATLSRNGDLAAALVVTIASSDETAATAEASVTIEAGEESTTFEVVPVDDDAVDGSQSTAITASADGFAPAEATVTVTDDDVAASSDLLIGLYDAETDDLIRVIEDGTTLSLDEFTNQNVTLAAFVPEDSPFFGLVESMFIDLNDGEETQTENAEPYALFGDEFGDFNGGALPTGDNTLSFDLFSEDRLRGENLGTVTRSFSVEVPEVDVSEAVQLVLVDAGTDTVIQELSDGDQILASSIDGKRVSLAAFLSEDTFLFDLTESVGLNLNDGDVTRVENVEPYALFGDNPSTGDFGGRFDPFDAGENGLELQLFSESKARGDVLASFDLSFEFVDDLV